MKTRSSVRACNLGVLVCSLLAICGCSATQMTASSHDAVAPAAPVATVAPAAAPETPVRHVSAADPDLMLFGTDPVRQIAASSQVQPQMQARTSTSVQQQTFSEVGRDFDADVDGTGKIVVFASTRHSARPNLYLQAAKGRAVTQLTSDPASAIQPRFSPDGKKVAFASDRNGQWDIFILDLEHRTTVQVTHSQDHELTPAWSPDGKWLAYSRLSSASGIWELWTASLEDGTERCIGQGLMPRYSPDGTRIAFQKPRERDGRLYSIWTVQLNNGEPSWPMEVAAEPDAALICPAWSPDGSKIAFCRVPAPGLGSGNSATARPGQADLFVVDADGSERMRLTDGGASFGPCWSSEGRVYFSADRDGRERIWSIKMAGTGKTNLASTAMAGGEEDLTKGTHP